MEVMCDNCNKYFNTSLIGRHIENGISLYFLKCPKCKAEFKAFYENAESRALRGKIGRLRKKYSRMPIEGRDKLQADIDKIVAKNTDIMNSLAEKYGGNHGGNIQ
jgi:DNA-directed RNA polymerase subunit M/transcription elongation factor TFIIS